MSSAAPAYRSLPGAARLGTGPADAAEAEREAATEDENTARRVGAALRKGVSTGVVSLNAAHLAEIPSGVFAIDGLHTLRASDNYLTTLASDVAKVTSLRVLHLSRNNITELPKEAMRRLTALEHLDLSENFVSAPALSGWLDSLSSLTYLNLTKNNLEWLPEDLFSCATLQELYLTGNSLMELPSSIGELKALTVCYVNLNRLKSLPKEMAELESLEEIDTRGNPMRFPSPALVCGAENIWPLLQAVKVRSERQARRRAALQGGSENTGSGGGRSGGAPRTPLGESRSRNVPRPSSPKEAIDLDKMERKHEADMLALSAVYEEQVASVRSALGARLDEATAAHASEMADLQAAVKRAEETTESMQQAFEERLAERETALAQQLMAIKARQDDEITRQKKANAALKAKAKEERRRAEAAAVEAAATHRAVLDERDAQHAAEMAAVREALRELKAAAAAEAAATRARHDADLAAARTDSLLLLKLAAGALVGGLGAAIWFKGGK